MVVFLTDGLPTAGIVDETLIGRSVTDANAELRARLHVFGVGYDVNTHLLDRLAGDNHGSVTYVQPGENLEMRLTEFYGRIAHPILTDVEVEFEGVEASDLYPQNLPDLFHGSSLLLAGRYHASGDDITVRVSGRAGEEVREFAYQFDLERAGGNDFVARLWATRRIGALLDEVRVRGETQDLVAEISDLGTAYGVATPYTTFVIESQLDGVTSAENMSLYKREDLNQAWGETTIQARVQNQAYQQATRASLASGANVVRAGGRYLAQMGNQYVDLSLLDRESVLDGVIDVEWINRNPFRAGNFFGAVLPIGSGVWVLLP